VLPEAGSTTLPLNVTSGKNAVIFVLQGALTVIVCLVITPVDVSMTKELINSSLDVVMFSQPVRISTKAEVRIRAGCANNVYATAYRS
jgi:hypothetical protein